MSRVHDFSCWSVEAVRARLAELRVAKAAIEAEELALIGALEKKRRQDLLGDSGVSGANGPLGAADSDTGSPDSVDSPPVPPKLDLSPGSVVEVLTEEAQISPNTARAMVGLAVALEKLPMIAKAFREGEISREIAEELAKFVTPENEEELLGFARHWSVSEAIAHRRAAVAITRDEAREISNSRELRIRWSRDRSSVVISGTLTADGGAKLDAALSRIVTSMPKKLAGERLSYRTRLADALVELASVRIGSDCDPDRATLSVHVDYETLISGGSNAEIHTAIGVGYISPDVARRIACDPRLEIVLDGPDGLALGVGRMTRKIPAWLARQIRYRDKTCIHPGCDRSFGLEVHHIISWADGGRTDYD
ncbi:MAG: hypothetical protein DCC49_00005, partial [Acidobacteria bacterium]